MTVSRRPGRSTKGTRTRRAGAAAPARPALFESKLAPPAPRPGIVSRSALVNRLRVPRPGGVAAVVAPLGYGKTTLLAEWERRDPRPFAWVSVDEGDDARTLLDYLAAAVERTGATERPVVDELAAVRGTRQSVAVVGRALTEARAPLVIVLDDVHLLHEDAAFEAVSVLAAHLPRQAQLAIAGRTDPKLPLARLRAEGRLLELGADDLRLTQREAVALLRGAGVDLPADEVAALVERTEGWPAGLYLAALSLRSGSGSPASSFEGSDRFVTDYFRLELMAGLPEDELAFLTRTSVLDRMSGPLCDAVLDREGAAEELEALERSNLFVVPLDRSRRWYRYHHLFRDMLRNELERREPARVAELAGRASAWFEDQGHPEEAIEYAGLSGDVERELELIAAAALNVYNSGRFASLDRWFGRLDDEELLIRHPAIAVFGAWCHALRGRAEAAERWVRIVDRLDDAAAMPDGARCADWRALLHAVRCRRGAGRMRTDAEQAAKALAASPWGPAALLVLGAAHLVNGDPDAAGRAFADALERALAAHAADTAAFALGELATIAVAEGQWDEAEALAGQGREVVAAAQLHDYVTTAALFAASARSALYHNDWVRARDDIDHVTALLPLLTAAIPWFSVQVRLELARAHLALTDARRAGEVMAEVDELLAERPRLGALGAAANELRAQIATTHQDDGWAASLTSAELRLIPLLTTHLSFREIAERLFVSRNTVKTQAISVYRKLGVSSRSEAIERAAELGLVDELRMPSP